MGTIAAEAFSNGLVYCLAGTMVAFVFGLGISWAVGLFTQVVRTAEGGE